VHSADVQISCWLDCNIIAACALQVGMATGATIHTANGMMMRVTPRQARAGQQQQQQQEPAAATV
jgi:hypothetical protein